MYKIAICDDEPQACALLQKMLENCTDVPELVIKTFYSGEALCESVNQGKSFDLFILDIELRYVNGVKVGWLLRKELGQSSAQLLYISGKQEYAMQLFDLRPLNFLLKPLKEKKVHECLRQAVYLAERSSSHFEYKFKKILHRVAYRDVRYFESSNKTVIIHTVSGEDLMIGQLSEIIQSSALPPNFIQVHQSYLINYDYVERLGYKQLTLDDSTEITISYPYRKEVRDRICALSVRQEGA